MIRNILFLVLFFLILYRLFSSKTIETLDNVSGNTTILSTTGPDALKNLSDISRALMTGGVTIPGDVNILGNISSNLNTTLSGLLTVNTIYGNNNMQIGKNSGYALYLNNDKTSGDIRLNTNSVNSKVFIDNGLLTTTGDIFLNGNSSVWIGNSPTDTATQKLRLHQNQRYGTTYVDVAGGNVGPDNNIIFRNGNTLAVSHVLSMGNTGKMTINGSLLTDKNLQVNGNVGITEKLCVGDTCWFSDGTIQEGPYMIKFGNGKCLDAGQFTAGGKQGKNTCTNDNSNQKWYLRSKAGFDGVQLQNINGKCIDSGVDNWYMSDNCDIRNIQTRFLPTYDNLFQEQEAGKHCLDTGNDQKHYSCNSQENNQKFTIAKSF